MKRLIIALLSGALLFFSGYQLHKPKTITVTKEIPLYDFSQEPRAMEIYANMMGKTLKNLDEYNKQKEAILVEIRSLEAQIRNLGIDEIRTKVEKEKLEIELDKLRNPQQQVQERKKRWYQF